MIISFFKGFTKSQNLQEQRQVLTTQKQNKTDRDSNTNIYILVMNSKSKKLLSKDQRN